MPAWVTLVVVACVVVLTAVLVPTILALRRTLRRAEVVLTIAEQEMRPLIGQAHALTEDVRLLTREASQEIERVGEMTERVNAAAEGMSRVVTGLAGLTRVGQVIGMAAGLKRGVDVFLQRWLKEQGDQHAQ
jgi:uncharacterized protein YoxC